MVTRAPGARYRAPALHFMAGQVASVPLINLVVIGFVV
jgi:hypothetical protein